MSDHSGTLTGRWQGKYSYAPSLGVPPCAFNAVLSEDGANLSGDIIEPNTFAQDGGDTLMAAISGGRDGLEVTFTKIYTDVKTDHVSYSGTANEALTRISGTWRISLGFWRNLKGTFVMVRLKAPGTAQKVEVPETADITS